ncbi:hypothetical protein LINGRAHAP2_LOCUS15364, partial [Linum grandiflorum]
GYSAHSKAFRVFNKRSRRVEESINVLFDETLCEDVSLQDIDDDVFGIPSQPLQTTKEHLPKHTNDGESEIPTEEAST